MISLEDVQLRSPDWATINRFGDVGRMTLRNEIGIIGSNADQVLAHLGGCGEVFVTIRDCLGGDMDTALSIWAHLVNVHTEVLIVGRCHSAAVIVAMAGCRVRMRHDAQLLIHEPQAAVFGGIAVMEKASKRLRSAWAQLIEIFSVRTGQDVELIDDWIRKGATFTAAAALEANLIDEIIPPAPVAELEKPSAESGTAAPSLLPTEDEALFYSMLQAMGGDFKVRSKAEFCRTLQAFMNRVEECE